MKFKPWQLWGLMPTILGGIFFYGSINPPKQAEAVTAAAPSRKPLTPQELIEQRLKQGPAPKAGLPKAALGVTLTTLYRFKGSEGIKGSEGRLPRAGVNYIDNVFYGTTANGGANDDGTIFKLTPAGHVLTTLHSFNNTDGYSPSSRLIGDKEGNFYSTTAGGGAYNSGTIFKLSPSGILTTVYSFNGKGEGFSPSKLFRNGSGYLFGTTLVGGANRYGMVFRLSPGGNLKVLHSFNGSDGAYPYAGLIQDRVGNFCGTTSQGGANRYGTIFKLTSDGTLTTLHSFNGSDGANPRAELIQDSVGNFYGTTEVGGANDSGTVFKLTPDGTLTTLHSFNDSDGANPRDELVQDSVGNLFGTTQSGGANDSGTVFQVTPDGAFTSLYSFEGVGGRDGYSPNDVRLFKGALYGTTFNGGTFFGTCRFTSGCGTIFKLSISPSAPVRKHSPQPMLQSPPSNPNE